MDGIFRLNLTLENFVAVAVAVSYLQLPVVQQNVCIALLESKTEEDLWKGWENKVIKLALKQVQVCLPYKLLTEVKNLIQILGHKMCCFIMYVTFHLKYDVRYVDHIYWTSTGEIDEMRMLREHLKVSGLSSTSVNAQHTCFWNNPTFCMACTYVEENFLNFHLEEMKTEICKQFSSELQYDLCLMEWSSFEIIGTWSILCKCKTKTIALETFKNLLHDRPKIVFESLQNSVQNSCKHAFEYYFANVDNKNKIAVIYLLLPICWDIFRSSNSSYAIENSYKILTTLVQNIDDNEKLEFIEKNFYSLFMKLLYMWPYQKVCLNILLNDYPCYSANALDKIFKEILEDLCNFGYKTQVTRYLTKGVFYCQIFQILLDIVPKKLKEDTFTKDNNKFLKSLMSANVDCRFLCLIINDSVLKNKRSELIQMYMKSFILEGGRYRDVNKLMVLCEYNDKKKFNFLNTFLMSGDIDLAKAHLDWLCDSEEEKVNTKNRIDCLSVCTALIKCRKYSSASEYLKWHCGNNEEKQKMIKKNLISKDFLHDEIYKMWSRIKNRYRLDDEIKVIENNCQVLLSWFFEKEEDILEFRKTRLIENDGFFERYWDISGPSELSYGLFRKFLKFCLWSPERMKKRIEDNVDWWIDTYIIKKYKFFMVDWLFSWGFSPSKKYQMISDYMESPKGALLLLTLLMKNCKKPELLNFWIGNNPQICISKIKQNLDTYRNINACDNTISIMKSLLDDLEIGMTGWNLMIDMLLKVRHCKCPYHK